MVLNLIMSRWRLIPDLDEPMSEEMERQAASYLEADRSR